MNREILVHIRVNIMIANDSEFRKKLEEAYIEFKKSGIKDKDFYDKTNNKEFSFYELTYFDKMKNPKYKEMIEVESNIMLSSIENILNKRRK